jgi:hypothetical protein
MYVWPFRDKQNLAGPIAHALAHDLAPAFDAQGVRARARFAAFFPSSIVSWTQICDDLRMTRQIPLAFPMMIGAIGLILIAVSAISLVKAQATKNWPSVAGKVIRAQIVPVEKIREKKQKLVLFRPEVVYSYTVDGKEFVTDTIRADLSAQAQTAEAELLLEKYPAGQSVAVFYNPANPAEAVLEPGRNPQTQSLLICGIALVVVSTIMLVVRFRERPQPMELKGGNGSPTS